MDEEYPWAEEKLLAFLEGTKTGKFKKGVRKSADLFKGIFVKK